MLSLVLPKGSLERATLELFDAADLTVRRGSDRDYHASIDDPRIDRVRFLRPQEIPAIVDAIVDVTETGSSLRAGGLRILEILLTSYTELVANPAAYEDPGKRAAMEDIALLLSGAIQARGNVLVKLNVPSSRLAAVIEMLPAMSSPTITALASGDMNAVETVVPKRGANPPTPPPHPPVALDIPHIPLST